jgi:hypothetical protein
VEKVETFEAKISIGFQEEYSDVFHSIDEVYSICQKYCDEVGLCVTITPTTFVYTKGCEAGCFIGLINYPRFPSTKNEIKGHAESLSKLFLKEFRQLKISIICSDETIMIQPEDLS